jgi:hypothetical protein
MHTFTSRSTNVKFHHNGDYSGEVLIAIPGRSARLHDGHVEVGVPVEALLEFAAEYIRDQSISTLETATTAQLLGVKLP